MYLVDGNWKSRVPAYIYLSAIKCSLSLGGCWWVVSHRAASSSSVTWDGECVSVICSVTVPRSQKTCTLPDDLCASVERHGVWIALVWRRLNAYVIHTCLTPGPVYIDLLWARCKVKLCLIASVNRNVEYHCWLVHTCKCWFSVARRLP